MFPRLEPALPVALLLSLMSGCDSASPSCGPDEVLSDDGCKTLAGPTSIRSTSVGFLPSAKKRVTYLGPDAAFQVRLKTDGDVVYEGVAGPEVAAIDTGEVVRFVDFDELSEPGTYVVTVDGAGRSAPFSIGDDVFLEPFRAAMLGMYGLRCGTAVSFHWDGSTFEHGECHMDDEAPGGWHDAGDYGKYTTNGSFSLAMMLVAWDHFQDKLEPLELEIPGARRSRAGLLGRVPVSGRVAARHARPRDGWSLRPPDAVLRGLHGAQSAVRPNGHDAGIHDE